MTDPVKTVTTVWMVDADGQWRDITDRLRLSPDTQGALYGEVFIWREGDE